MWILVFFDLPTDSKKERKEYAKFRKQIMSDGFNMFQFSIYVRHCPSQETANIHIQRIEKILPPKGKIGILCITDKQFGNMKLFNGMNSAVREKVPQQLELF